jgi:hypothetical protein
MSEQYALYVFPHAEAGDQLASEIAALSGCDAIEVKVALEEGGRLAHLFNASKAKQLAEALGLLGLMVELRATLPVGYGSPVQKPTTPSIRQIPPRSRKHPFIFGLTTIFLFIGILGWSPWRSEASPLPGMSAPAEPFQEVSNATPWQQGDYLITPLANYTVTARVLSKKEYTKDKSATLSPVDLALGWGVMSDAAVLSDLRISQSGRWFYVYWKDATVDTNQVMTHSANTHILPATPEIARKVKTIERNQVVHLQGYLVQVTKRDGFLWRSSLTRSDTGDGSCEVLWVTEVEVVPATQLQAQR